jgi:hypothetical protein
MGFLKKDIMPEKFVNITIPISFGMSCVIYINYSKAAELFRQIRSIVSIFTFALNEQNQNNDYEITKGFYLFTSQVPGVGF